MEVAALPKEISWCVVKSLPGVGAQLDCARAARVPATTPLAASGYHVRDGQTAGGRVCNVAQSDDWRDVAVDEVFQEVHPEQFLRTQKAYLDRLYDLHLN